MAVPRKRSGGLALAALAGVCCESGGVVRWLCDCVGALILVCVLGFRHGFCRMMAHLLLGSEAEGAVRHYIKCVLGVIDHIYSCEWRRPISYSPHKTTPSHVRIFRSESSRCFRPACKGTQYSPRWKRAVRRFCFLVGVFDRYIYICVCVRVSVCDRRHVFSYRVGPRDGGVKLVGAEHEGELHLAPKLAH